MGLRGKGTLEERKRAGTAQSRPRDKGERCGMEAIAHTQVSVVLSGHAGGLAAGAAENAG